MKYLLLIVAIFFSALSFAQQSNLQKEGNAKSYPLDVTYYGFAIPKSVDLALTPTLQSKISENE
jgi:hypothetical protein